MAWKPWRPVGAVEGALQRRDVADIGLDHVDLAHVAQQPHLVGQVRVADRHADAPAGLGQIAHGLGPHEAGAAEDGDEVLHDGAAGPVTLGRLRFRRCGDAPQSAAEKGR
jgi:hypothetical protein